MKQNTNDVSGKQKKSQQIKQILNVTAIARLRRMLLDNKDIMKELEELKQITDERFQIVFETLDQLLTVNVNEKKKIGFIVKEKASKYGKKK
ncbi:MAG: hypothetical protein JRE47_11795 [Deltaproteobacteria bacterium]|nr:hypothetical protein [Deltaproteobacteria bacterium]